MPLTLSPATIYNHLLLSLAKKTVILNYHKYCPHRLGHAMLYYKTDSLTSGYWHEYLHTNQWEIAEKVRILNQLGYWVDIIDRGASTNWQPDDIYQLFIGIGIDGSGHHYLRLAKQVPSAIKVLYATSSNPDERNQFVKQRYSDFEQRTGHALPIYRTAENINTSQTAQITDHIICVGNHVTNHTFKSFNRPIHKIFLSTSPRLVLDYAAYQEKKSHNFLFLSGAGNILKGLDLLLETFAKLPHLNLYVCTALESAFVQHYSRLLAQTPNIHIENFVRIHSERFRYLTNICGYVILPSCTEGCATSVTSSMRRGLVPVVTRQCGIDVENFGHYIDDISIPGLSTQISQLATVNSTQLRERVALSYQASAQYTQRAFSVSFTQALLSILKTT